MGPPAVAEAEGGQRRKQPGTAGGAWGRPTSARIRPPQEQIWPTAMLRAQGGRKTGGDERMERELGNEGGRRRRLRRRPPCCSPDFRQVAPAAVGRRDGGATPEGDAGPLFQYRWYCIKEPKLGCQAGPLLRCALYMGLRIGLAQLVMSVVKLRERGKAQLISDRSRHSRPELK
ncbi:hypothetical protein GQ55_3G019000 [Panicum hallii var. hallii]|uniref:Uncharacterized protein n=1 Tax=Panicum hallii var. hallii TaxID=1504633 RepID=A0A2T7E4W4_9POAL|nr:hypothetical protein GQ55_3G019000 [Panicum hallii var. hallii]